MIYSRARRCKPTRDINTWFLRHADAILSFGSKFSSLANSARVARRKIIFTKTEDNFQISLSENFAELKRLQTTSPKINICQKASRVFLFEILRFYL